MPGRFITYTTKFKNLISTSAVLYSDQNSEVNQIYQDLNDIDAGAAKKAGEAAQSFSALKFTGSSTTDASSSTDTAAAFSTAGGGAFAKKLYVGTNLSVGGTINDHTLNTTIGLSGFAATIPTEITDWNAAFDKVSVYTALSTATNAPSANLYVGMTYLYTNASAGSGFQFAGRLGNNTYKLRSFLTGSAQPWVEIAHTTKSNHFTGQIMTTDTTVSTSTTTGALVVSEGGAGIKGALNVGGVCTIQGATVGVGAGGSGNTYFGINVGANITTGGSNSIYGSNAGSNITSGATNSIFGATAGGFLTTGGGNSIYGSSAGYNLTTGGGNSIFGSGAGYNLTTGINNCFFGLSAGFLVTTGSNLTVIGPSAAASSATATNEATFGNSSTTVYRMYAASWTNVSDKRDKKNIETIPIGLDFINDLKPVKFIWNMRDKSKIGIKDSGFIAQDFKEITKKYNADWLGLVYESNPNKLEISAGKLLPVLVRAIQELTSKIKQLESQIN